MQLISKFNKGIRFLLYVIDIFSKYTWVITLKDEKGVTVTNAFQKILKESDHKPNKIWVDLGSECYNRSMKSWLEKNDIEMYLTNTKGKSVVAERFIRTLKNKIFKYMTSISKNVCIDKLVDLVNQYNNTCVRSSTYIDFIKEYNKQGSKFKVGDHVRILKYKNIFAKSYVPNWSEEVFLINKVSVL